MCAGNLQPDEKTTFAAETEMSVEIETAELISALKAASKEALDVIEATEDVEGEDLTARGHNAVRDAAKDAHNICNNLLRRLGASAVMPPKPEPAPKPVEQPEPEAPAEAVLRQMDQLETVQEVLAEAATDPEVSDVPPDTLADLFDPELTARQNQEALLKKYKETMSMREIHLSHNETSEAMECLRKAERLESGIKWNRARLAEVI